MQSALRGVKRREKSLIKHVEMSAVGSGREQMPAAFSLLDEFILLEEQLLLLRSCQMDLYIDLGQVGMSKGEFGKAGSPCWQQPMPCQGTRQGFGRDVLGSSLDCFCLQEHLLTWIMSIVREDFLLGVHPQERLCLIPDLCFHFMPGVPRP